MLFSSLEFLYLFLPLTVLLYFLSPNGAKNYILLFASLVFYGIAEPSLLPLLLAVCLADFALGLAVEKSLFSQKEKRAKALVAVAMISNVGILFFFKYLDPLLSLFGAHTLGITLPVGISFYTFQAMSYVCDVYRRASRAQKDPLLFLTYVSLFPQLIAGPIVRYCDIDKALSKRKHSISLACDGIKLFCVGLAKKLILANSAGEEWERLAAYSKTDGTVLGAWLGVVFFAFQIYFDFSGYSDMARGLGKIFGFDFPENFRYPYAAKSITDFWRRWHITLSLWFREYVYIPLGGNRRGRARMYVNLLIVWSLTGLWHGATPNFLLWGLYFFVLLSLEKAFLLKWLSRAPSIATHAYAIFFILVGWLIFASDGTVGGIAYAGQLFGIGATPWNNDTLFELVRNIPFLIILAVGCTPLPKRTFERFFAKAPLAARVASSALAVLSLVISTCYVAASGYNPFLYFRF
ncbi:MAG: MBOAT family protein [Ruminococcaceae bacterium]|nr:MBOAT family protein [Oscillospiraceae bacterium]